MDLSVGLPAVSVGLLHLILVAVGGGLGGAGRLWVSGVVSRRAGEAFPWGLLAVNVSGALCIGLLAGAFLSGALIGDAVSLWAALVIGALGSYTTVSAFSLQTLLLTHQGQWRRAMAYVILSLVLSIAAAGAGLFAVHWVVGG